MKYYRQDRIQQLSLLAIENKVASSPDLTDLYFLSKLRLRKDCNFNCYFVVLSVGRSKFRIITRKDALKF